MPNLRLIHDNAADRATSLAASTTSGALVAANLQNDFKGQVHRSTGTSVSYTLTWTAGETVGAVALPATNLSASATVRVRLYSDTGGTTLIADSGTINACPGLNLGLWNWALPLNGNAFAFGGASKSAVWFDAHYFARRCVIDLVDTGNTLRANGLVPMDLIAPISSRLVVNKASMKMKHAAVKALTADLAAAVARRARGEGG